MPLVQVFTSAAAPAADAQKALLAELSKLLAARFQKPERWVMTCLCPDLAMTFGGTPAPAAFVAVRNVGKMTADDTSALSAALCDRLSGGARRGARSHLRRVRRRRRLPVGLERRNVRVSERLTVGVPDFGQGA